MSFLERNTTLGREIEYIVASLRMYQSVVTDVNAGDYRPNRILDIGCSIGYGTHLLSTGIARTRVVGIDIDKEKIRECRRLFDSSQADFRLVDITSSQEVTSLVEEEGLFDITVCFELFEHIPPKTSGMLLENMKLLLRDGGLLFISTPNKDIYDIDTYTEGHVNELPCDRFLETLEGSGFRLLDVKGIMQKSATSSFLLREFGLAKRDGDRKTRPSKAQVLLRKAIVSVLDRRGLFAYFLNHISWKRYLEWKYRKAMNASPEQSSIVLVKACHDRKG